MPSFVIAEKCDGCKGGDKTACMYICPNDLMVLDANAMKAYNQEPDQCWECYVITSYSIHYTKLYDLQPRTGSVLGMLLLRKNLPLPGHRSKRLL